MAYIVTESCIKCKYMECVEACPVDCFHEGENMVVIDPSSCIDCGVCEPECPVDALSPDSFAGIENMVKVNAIYSKIWPTVTRSRKPSCSSELYKSTANKFEKYFSVESGTGDAMVSCDEY